LLALAFCVFGGLVHFLFFCFDHCQRGPASPDVGASAQCSQRFLYARGSFPGRRGPAPTDFSGGVAPYALDPGNAERLWEVALELIA